MTKSYYSTILDNTAEEVWAAVRDFNGLGTYFSAVVSKSFIEDDLGSTTIGAVRNLTLPDGVLRERLVAMSDLDRSYSYALEEPHPFPVTNYIGNVRVTPVVKTGQALIEWWSTFDCAEDVVTQMEALFANEIYANAVEGLRKHLS